MSWCYAGPIVALLFVSAATSQGDGRNIRNPPDKYVKLALEASRAAYESLHDAVNYMDSACNIDSWSIVGCIRCERRDSEVFLFRSEKQKLAVFAFRGTEPTNINDWIKNFDIRFSNETFHTHDEHGEIQTYHFKLHNGFKSHYSTIEPWFMAWYRELLPNYTIVLTGHSLGGALATIAAAYASAQTHHQPDAVITFGAPRVGNEEFRQFYRHFVDNCFYSLRIIEIGDKIPEVPPVTRNGYRHTCPPVKVNHGGSHWNPVTNHALDSYEKGVQRYYGHNVHKFNLGCDRIQDPNAGI